MKILIRKTIIILVILFPTITLSDEISENKSFDFRKAKWGMTQKEVSQSEGIPAKSSSGDNLIFESVLANTSTLVEYFFSNGRLTGGMYFINQGYYDPSKHHKDFVSLNKLLTNKYGKPISDKKNWSGTKSIRKELDEPNAVYLGYLELSTNWETKRTLISHIIKKSGSEGGIHHSILFTDKKNKT